MPRIDIIKEKFKKKEYRAWDNNLLEALKIPKNDSEEDFSQEKTKSISSNSIINEENNNFLRFNKSSNEVQQQSEECSISVTSEFDQGVINGQLESDYSSSTVHNIKINSAQLGFNNNPIQVEELIRKLGGNERKIFLYILDICIAKGTLSTGEIPGKNFVDTINSTKNGMETALKRLRNKGLIHRDKGKTGKHGLINIAISETIKNIAVKYLHNYQHEQEILQNRGSIRVQSSPFFKVPIVSNDPIYSSNKYKNITTELAPEWQKIDISPLEGIGFTQQHLLDIYSTNLCDLEVVQESINHFAFGLEQGRHVAYDNPLKVFVGRLRKGHGWIESNYESPKVKALRELVERKKAEKEKWDAMVKELVELEFPEWKSKLDESEINNIVPEETLKTKLTPAINAYLKGYFVENILLPKLASTL